MWANTMTPSDLPISGALPVGAQGLDLSPVLQAVPFGLPDAGELSRLANELFREAPLSVADAPDVNGLVLSPLQSVPVAAPVPTPIPTRPGLPAGTELPQSFPGAFGQSPVAITHPVTAAPSAVSTPSPKSGLSFLDDARALYGAVPFAIEPPTVPFTGLPFEGDLKALTSLVPPTGFDPIQAPTGGLADVSHPQIAGAPVGELSRAQNTIPAFVREATPLVPINVFPTIGPVSNDIGGLPTLPSSAGAFDVQAIRRDFPILSERVNGRPLIWLDNAATTQKPQSVIDRLSYFYQHENSNIHRAAHTLAARATDAYEGAREKVRRFLNAGSVSEIIFVRGTTEGINLIAQTYGLRNVLKDDEIVITHLEHHANIVPWQMLCATKGARLRVAPVDDSGQIILEEFEKLLNSKTKIVSITQVSNALGTVTPVKEMTAIAHRYGAKVVIDGAQSVSHMAVDVQAYDCDFFVFSGHKVFGPTGIGVVYGKQDVLAHMPPYQGGGNMIADVTFEKTLYHAPPMRFEAGTGNIADAVGLGAAIDYVERVGMHNIARYEHELLVYGTERLLEIPGLHLIGTAKETASVLSFVLDGFKTEEVGHGLSQQGIAVRSGHHCAQPILRRFGQESTVRPSLAFYNTCEEIDVLIAAIWNIKNGRTTTVA